MKFHLCGLSCCFSSSSSNSQPLISKSWPDFCSKKIKPTKPGDYEQKHHQNLRIFSSQELEIATQNFSSSNKVGEGAFGSVYKGRAGDGSFVAIKVLSVEMESMRGEREFISELTALCNLSHENLVKLQGCCVDGAHRYLVYDYMENNSLAQTLLGKEVNRKKFRWEARREISIGVARGLAYLHEEVEPHILHRDIKASNVLLDQNFTPKLGDFGLSRLLRDTHSHVSTNVAGTLGYLAPEYALSGHLTRKSDVYSFGVLLLEIMSGRSAVDFDLQLGEHYLVQKAWKAYKEDNILQVIDPRLNMNFPQEEAVRLLMISLLCVQETAKLRPNMSAVVNMMTNHQTDLKDIQISQPGFLSNLMDIRLHHPHTSRSTSSSTSSFN